MSFSPDDLAQLFVPPNVENPPRYVQGILEEWNPETFNNAVRYRGAVLRDLAVINGIEALSFETGITVSLLGQSGTGQLTSFAILGRYIQPGSDATSKAIASLQSNVAEQIAAEIFANRITAAIDTAIVTTADSAGYQELGGPLVVVDIGPTGKALVFLSAVMSGDDTSAVGASATVGARMSFEITGATVQAGSNERSLAFDSVVGVGGAITLHEFAIRPGTTILVEGLNPGIHTFNCIYARLRPGTPIEFADRVIAVIAF